MRQLIPEHLPGKVLRALDIQSGYDVTPLAGNENDNYLVTHAKREVVVKRLHSAYNVAEIQMEGMYRVRLADSGLPVTKYLPMSGNDVVLTIKDTNYVAMPYVDGATPAYSQGLAVQIAELLARTHKVNATGLVERATWFREGYIADSVARISDQYIEAKRAFAGRRAQVPDLWHNNLPRGIVHGDMHNENIIVDDKQKIASVIDWEETTIQPLLLDVALTARFMCFRKGVCNVEIFHAFMNAYQRIRPLTALEKEWFGSALNYTALVLSVWAHLKVSEGQIGQGMFADLGNRYKIDYIAPTI